MKKKNFMADKAVYKEYDRWINGPNLFTENYFDRERFYSFVISCVRYVKYQNLFITKQEAWKSIDMDELKVHLSADLSNMDISNWKDKLYEIIVKFEMLIEYEKIRYSQGLK